MSQVLSFGFGEDAGSLLSWGMGYVTVVISPAISVGYGGVAIPQAKLMRLKRRYAFRLAELKIIKLEKVNIELASLSFYKLSRMRVLLSSLGVVLPKELEMFVKELAVASEKFEEIDLDKLSILMKEEEVYIFDVLGLVGFITKELKLQIPDIYLLSVRQMAEYIELLDLLDDLNNGERLKNRVEQRSSGED